MNNVSEFGNIESNFIFLNRYCTIVTTFKDNTASAPVSVVRPTLSVTKDGNPVTLQIMKPLSPTGATEGQYSASFLSDNLTEGIYKIKATGYYPDNTAEVNLLSQEDEIQIMNVDNIQSMINMLRVQLHDHLPKLYIIDDPEKFRWEDGELFQCLERAVDFWNETPPISSLNSSYSLDTFPHPDVMLWMGEFYALNMKGLLEIFNTMSYNDDISFTIDRFPKIQQKMQMLLNTAVQRIKEMKKDSTWRRSKPLGIRSTKLPLRAIQGLSLQPFFSFLSGSGY